MSLLKPAVKLGRKFQNPVPANVGGFKLIGKVLPEYIRNALNKSAEVEPKQPLGPFTTDAGVYATPPASGLRVTWFGHSSLLLEIDGVRVLVDPVWDERASPFSWTGPKRFSAPTIALEDLPPVDVVLISHDHYDHLGEQTVRRLAKLASGARWVTSLGVGAILQRFGVSAAQIKELDWTQSWTQPVAVGGLTVTAWPARHFSGRSLLNRFETLWGSFVLEGPKHRVFYGADSGPWPGFAEIAAQYDGFDLTMLGIGAYHPLWGDIHLGPDHTAEAFVAMGARGLLMPIHWGLFNLALHDWDQPVERIVALAEKRGLPLWLPVPGEPTEVVAGQAVRSLWWRRAGRGRG
jgi:L-ascorbate metabolism protein UlaG (beta-lactamase superfamily)